MGPPFDAVVLAGGRARRLGGVDKPGLDLAGRTLLRRVADAAGDARRLVVVGPSRPDLPGAVFTREDPPGAGPVPAIAAGLTRVSAPWVAVLAADLPFLRPGHLAALHRLAVDRDGALLVDDGGQEQWLAGMWRTDTLHAALRGYGGRSVRGLLGPLRFARYACETGEGVPPPWLDCDTMGDVETAREWTWQT